MNQINDIMSCKKFTFFYYLILIDVFLSIFATKLSFYLRKPSRSQLLDKLPDNIWNFSDFSPNRISYFVLECVIASFIAFCGELYAIMMEYFYYAWFPLFFPPHVRVSHVRVSGFAFSRQPTARLRLVYWSALRIINGLPIFASYYALLCICHCFSHLFGLFSVACYFLSYKFTLFFSLMKGLHIRKVCLYQAIRIGSTPTFLYFDLYLNPAYTQHTTFTSRSNWQLPLSIVTHNYI